MSFSIENVTAAINAYKTAEMATCTAAFFFSSFKFCKKI
jgi:hypothetical protein